ncbi:adenosylmethionine-8-amino-7-oxononanoate aminotransferase [Streptomyces hygroscopicus]|nr:adenosylmethionine-8-amino-7-oxononanoate aminotransferase [Streptomyces hygroscopicus]
MPEPLGTGELLALNRQHVWHPYGPMPGRTEPLVVESAVGVRLRLAEPFEGHDEHTANDDVARICTAVRVAGDAG